MAVSTLQAPLFKQRYFNFTTASNSPYGWSVNITESGYTPMIYSLRYGNSGSTDIGVETFSATTLGGYASRGNLSGTAYVLYRKD